MKLCDSDAELRFFAIPEWQNFFGAWITPTMHKSKTIVEYSLKMDQKGITLLPKQAKSQLKKLAEFGVPPPPFLQGPILPLWFCKAFLCLKITFLLSPQCIFQVNYASVVSSYGIIAIDVIKMAIGLGDPVI